MSPPKLLSSRIVTTVEALLLFSRVLPPLIRVGSIFNRVEWLDFLLFPVYCIVDISEVGSSISRSDISFFWGGVGLNTSSALLGQAIGR